MQPTMLMQKEIQDKKDKLNVQLTEISNKTMQVCCYGGSNKSKSRTLSKILNSLIAEVYKSKNFFSSTSSCFGIPLDKWDNYFRESSGKFVFVNPDVFPIILKFISQKIKATKNINALPCYNYFQELKTYDASNFQPTISYLTYQWTTKVKSPMIFFENREEEIKIGSLYSLEKKMEPTDKKHRELLIQYSVNDIIFGSFYFGTGNCQLMAELAFLLGIQTLSSTPIRSVQFQNSQGKLEELNAIVVGNWPTPGCMVLAPWYSQKPFEWKGTFNKTPGINHRYDTTRILFTVKNPQEQDDLRELLKKLDFNIEKLLLHPNRSNYLKYIQGQCQKIYEITRENDKLSYNSLKN